MVILFVHCVVELFVEGAKAQFLKVKQTARVEDGSIVVDLGFTA